MYTGRSLPDTWNPERPPYYNPERSCPTQLRLVSKVQGLALRNPARQSSHTGGFLLVEL
jgi:hypothetical protein